MPSNSQLSETNEIHGDDENIWPVEEILDEKNGRYLIKWGGEDPHGNPWDNSWVPKRDVTDDLIEDWNRKKHKKKGRKSKGNNTSSQSYQPPATPSARASSSRILNSTSPNAAKRRVTRSSKSVAPDSESTRRSKTPKQFERLTTPPPRKRKRQPAATSATTSSVVQSDDESESSSPRKKRKPNDDGADLPSRGAAAYNDSSSKSKRKQSSGFVSDNHLSIYDEIPEPPDNRVKKLSDKAKTNARISPVDNSNHDTNNGLVTGRIGHQKPAKIKVVENDKSAKHDKKKKLGNSKPASKGESFTETMRSSAKELVEKEAEEEEEGREDDSSESGSSRQNGGLRSKDSRSASFKATKERKSASLGRRTKSRSLSKARQPPNPEAEVDEMRTDGEPSTTHPTTELEHDFVDSIHNLPEVRAEMANHPATPPSSSPTTGVRSAPHDTSIGTVIPETQFSKHNSSLDESSQSFLQDDAVGSHAMPEIQSDPVINVSNSGKVLKPIPIVTPSKFQPHLKPFSKVTGKAEALRKQIPRIADRLELPSSSIVSQFTPERNGENSASHWAVNGDDGMDISGFEDEIEDLQPSLELRTRGIELAEMDRMQRRPKLFKPKLSLNGILNHRETRQDAHAGHAQLDEDALVKQMEERYVNLDGSIDSANEVAGNAGDTLNDAYHNAQVDQCLSVVEETRAHVSPTTESSQQDAPQSMESPRTPQHLHISQRRQIISSPARQLDSALGLLNQKSEEIHDLKGRLNDATEERRTQSTRIGQLEEEITQLLIEQSKRTELDPTILAELELIRKERDNIANERDSALAELDLMKIVNQSALNDMAFIREQFEFASSRAKELADENVALQSHLNVAKSQVTNGLQLVRNQYDSRITALKVDLEKSRILSKILAERDRRTDDEVRKTAATVPQLEATIEKLNTSKSDLRKEIQSLVVHRDELLVAENKSKADFDMLQAQNNQLQAEILHLSVEVARYGARERFVKTQLDTFTPKYQHQSEVDPADEDVYLCEWMVDGKSRCGQIFSSVQELSDHLFIEPHL